MQSSQGKQTAHFASSLVSPSFHESGLVCPRLLVLQYTCLLHHIQHKDIGSCRFLTSQWRSMSRPLHVRVLEHHGHCHVAHHLKERSAKTQTAGQSLLDQLRYKSRSTHQRHEDESHEDEISILSRDSTPPTPCRNQRKNASVRRRAMICTYFV